MALKLIKKFLKYRTKKIIIASWSKNINKGFKIFKYLDQNFDKNKYVIDFGNTPFTFENINHMGALNYKDLETAILNYDLAIV